MVTIIIINKYEVVERVVSLQSANYVRAQQNLYATIAYYRFKNGTKVTISVYIFYLFIENALA